jgi:hypothetical protein
VDDKGLDFEQLVIKFRKFYSEEKWGAKPEWKALFEEEVRVLRKDRTSIP